MWLTVLLGVCALSPSEGRCQGLRSLLCLSYVPCACIPSTQRSEAQVLCGCVCPNHSNGRTGLQQQQQHRTATAAAAVPAAVPAASRRWSRVLAPQRGNPILAAGRTCTSLESSHSDSSTTAVPLCLGKVMRCNNHTGWFRLNAQNCVPD